MRGLRRRRTQSVAPAQLLDAAYAERLRALERIRRASDGVHATRARLESSLRSSLVALQRLEHQAREALGDGDEEAARSIAARCVPLDAEIAAANEQLGRYRATEGDLESMRQLVAEQLNSIRKRRESLRGARATEQALDSVRADLAALAAEFASVERELSAPEG